MNVYKWNAIGDFVTIAHCFVVRILTMQKEAESAKARISASHKRNQELQVSNV